MRETDQNGFPGDAARRKEEAARLSVFVSGGLAALKLVAAFLTGSLALLSDALHALIDVGATSMTWLAIRSADRPADETHHYGHAKIEAIVALVETAVLMLLALGILTVAVYRLSAAPQALENTAPAFLVLGIAIITDFLRWRGLSRVASETGSEALAADALHFSSDLVSSSLVLAGIVAASFGLHYADTISAMAVALFIGFAGYRLGNRTIDTLLDAAPKGVADEIESIARGVRGVADVERVRIRRAGATLFVEITAGVPRTTSSDRIGAIAATLRDAIEARYPNAEVTVSPVPRMLDTESALERILVIAAGRRTMVHHVTVQELDGRLSISFDIEVDGRLSLLAGHQIATRLEDAIREEFGPDTEVETHIEPLDVREIAGVEALPAQHQAIETALRGVAANFPEIGRVHDVRVRETPLGFFVNLHVEAAGVETIAAVHHAVDRLEQAGKQACPHIHRIVTHAEPTR